MKQENRFARPGIKPRKNLATLRLALLASSGTDFGFSLSSCLISDFSAMTRPA
jgi:hypothetical protein